ncbi:MAG: WD40 repeat domain-containing protein [Candidatus Lokiarchaeota archaeon]|nr:WD40 repeat domain-containing protein [Candidatus Lokiarchaeota archaeon]
MLKIHRSSKIIISCAFVLSVFIPTFFNVILARSIRTWIYRTDNYINDLDISTNGRYLTVGTYDRLYLFDTFENKLLWDKYLQALHVGSLSMSSDGNFFVAGVSINAPNGKGYVYYFDSNSSTPLWAYRTSILRPPVSISSDGEDLAAIYHLYTLVVLKNTNSTPVWNYTTDIKRIGAFKMSSDGSYVVFGISSGKAYLMNNSNIPSKRSVWDYSTGSEVRSVAISSNNEYIAVGSKDNAVYLFDKFKSALKSPIWQYTTQGEIISVEFSSDEKFLVVTSTDDRIYYFGTNSSIPLWTYRTNTDILSTAISDDGNYVTAADLKGNVYLLSCDTGSLVSRYKTKGESYALRISYEGNYIACAGHYFDGEVSEFRSYLFDRSKLVYGKDFSSVFATVLQNLVFFGFPTTIVITYVIHKLEFFFKKKDR